MILKIKDLNFKFKDKIILENSNISFYSNKITGIVGKNGVGKTTFFNLINNKYDFEGNIFLDNNTMNSLDVILVNSVPKDLYLVETDAPYISPHPFRDEINHSENVSLIIKRIADLLDKDFKEIENQTKENTLRLFKKIK